MEAARRTEHEPDLSQLLSCSVAVRAHHLAELGRPDPPRGSSQLKVLHTPPAAPRDRLRSRWPLALSARGDSLLDLDHEIGKAGTCDVGTKTATQNSTGEQRRVGPILSEMWVLPSGFTSAAVCSESAALVSFTRGQARHSYSPDIAGSRMGVWVGLTEPSFGLTGVSASGEQIGRAHV